MEPSIAAAHYRRELGSILDRMSSAFDGAEETSKPLLRKLRKKIRTKGRGIENKLRRAAEWDGHFPPRGRIERDLDLVVKGLDQMKMLLEAFEVLAPQLELFK